MVIAKVIRSNSHTDLVAEVYRPGERPSVPSPEDYAFGTFVSMRTGPGRRLVGIIYDTLLVNPEYGRTGPRITTDLGLERFMPDYIMEKATLLGIVSLGTILVQGGTSLADHSLPKVSANLEAEVEAMGPEQIREFHLVGGELSLGYLPRLLTLGGACVPDLIDSVLDRLQELFSAEKRRLKVLRTTLAWKTRVEVLR